MATFVDQVKVFVTAGNGGHGCASIKREKFKPLAGPDGGNGGHGGNVVFRVNPQATTLLSYHRSPHLRAENGGPGKGDFKEGKNGTDLVMDVPEGTVIKSESGEVLVDLVGENTQWIAAEGGVGGRGNAALASRRRKAPGFALLGLPGEEATLVLELKSMADVALVGFPSAGKSSLIAAMSQARPKIADYPFTTLIPNLGVVDAGGKRFTLADVPGLIPGAAQGKGLGLEFLRHIERCMVIVHVIDTASLETNRDPVSDLRLIEKELAAYAGDLEEQPGRPPLMERPRLIVLNKIDVPDGRELADMVTKELIDTGWPVIAVSAVSHEGLKELGYILAKMVEDNRVQVEKQALERPVLRPAPVNEADDLSVEAVQSASGLVYQVRGKKPERWVLQTDFANDEAVGFLADRLQRAGVEDALLKAGARAGDTVVIGPMEGGVIFDWEPGVQTGAELLGARGTDLRLDTNTRPSRKEKRITYYEWMDAKAAARGELALEAEYGVWTDPDQI